MVYFRAQQEIAQPQQREQTTWPCWRGSHRRIWSGTTSWHPPWSDGEGIQPCRPWLSCEQRSCQDGQGVHAVNANAWVVLDSQVNVLLDAKAEVAVVGEVLLHLEASLKNLLSLGAPDGAVDGDLLVPPDTKATDGVAGLREHRGLTGQRLQHLASPGEPITRLADTDVEAEFPDPQVPHGVLSLILATLDHPDLSLVEVNQAIK